MFRAGLNAWLPRKRVIAQGLLRDAAGKVLLCELTYKRFWDLPGGVVDPLESPATAVLREVAEELSLKAHIVGLAAVGWMPPWRGWDDALLCVFELRLDEEVSAAVLQPREIAGIHWADAEAVREHCAEYTVGLIDQLTRAVDAGAGTIYLENSLPPRW
ncbi:NUDIX domain-containing protein [Dermacoccaceae bacterium W4C1]